uniref:P-selectin-like isoform X2 n=1 Tax=Ciona intestinalis TaxID=7719 RepID=UPI000EF4452F|nr:P-selectin-like isoform X2 [Ciona intestinalis]|eukprot:XP_026695173.1 P-selectin-like isoform X2 [Ciona intestinalis]
MALSQQQKWVLFAALITAVVAASAGIVFGILVHLREETVTGKSTSYYGTIRMNRVEGKSLQWTSSLSNGSSTHSIGARSFLQSHLFESMSRLSRPLSSVNIIRFSEDKFAQLVGAKNRGIHVDFKLEIQDDIHGPEVENLLKDELLSILSNDERFELDPESLEIDTKPLMKARSFEAFETYLSEGDTFNLLNTQLPGVKQPLEMSQPKFCAKISTINHGSVSPVSCLMSNHSSLGDSCTFMCDTNFTIVGFKTLTCLSTGRWSGPQPLCKAKCPALPTYMGVKISPSICFQSASYSDTRCFYHCSMGYVLDGISARVCLDNGMWSGVAPMCKKTCAALSVPENGAVWPASCTSDTLQPAGSLCTYSCIEGYTLAGSPNLLCEMDGSWNFPAPTCRRGCPPLVPPEHGSIFPPLCSRTLMKGDHAAVVMEGVVCVHTCEPGFKLEGSRQRMCGTGGSWTGKVTTCSELCPVLPLPPLMTASPHICTDPHGDRVEGLKCHVMCPNNFCSAGEMDVTCGSRGVWSSIPTDCMSTCPILKPVMNGMLYPDDCRADLPAVVEGTKCTLKCGDGFMLHGSMSVQCLTIGKWSEELGQCLKQCPPLLPPSHGFIEPSNCTVASVYQGGVCNYVCDTDYGLIGEESRTCLTDGTWSSEEPTCLVETQFMIRQTRDERDVCLDVNTITNHAEKRPISQCYLNNRLQRWTVHPEGVIRNVGTRKCLSVEHRHPGSYIAMKECTSSDPNQIWLWEDTNGVSVTLLGTSLVMGYGYASIAKVILVDSSIESSLPWYAITSNGSFSLYDIFTTVGCPRLHPPYLMSISPEKCMTNQTLESGTTCTFTCDIGHKLKGNNRRTCVKGRWDGEYPSCSVACPSIPPPSGGSVTIYCQFMAQDEGVSCDFDCNQGYVLEGDVTTVCLSSGNWSNATPNCTWG